MAQLELFDQNNQSLGILKDKATVHQDGDWHRTSEIVVLNQQDEVLLSLRHPDKKYLPNYWDVCLGGHLDPGESYGEAALRELEEEIGLRPQPEELIFLGTMDVVVVDESVALRDFEHAGVFVWRVINSLYEFTMQPDEVAELKWMPIKDVVRDLNSPVPSLRYTPPTNTYCRTLEWVVQNGRTAFTNRPLK